MSHTSLMRRGSIAQRRSCLLVFTFLTSPHTAHTLQVNTADDLKSLPQRIPATAQPLSTPLTLLTLPILSTPHTLLR